MRNRINSKVARVTLTDIHHKINRRAMLFRMLDEEYSLLREAIVEANWMVEDRHIENICRIEEALDELIKAKIGDELTYCVIYQYTELKIKF